jgi:outer membrane protein assembly factor BamB
MPWLHLMILLSTLLLSACAPQRPPYAEDWPVYQADNGRGGYAPAGPEPPLKEKWSFQTQGRIVDAPVTAGGQIAFGSRDGWVYVLDAESGQLIWKDEIGQGGLASSPAFSRDYLFGGSWTPYYSVYAWERASGRRVLERTTGEILNRAPLVIHSQDTLYYNEDPPLSAPAEILAQITALALSDFKPRWQRPLTGVPLSMPSLNPSYTQLFLTLADPPAVTALNARTGDILWRSELDSKPTTAPLWSDGRILVGTEAGYLYSLKTENGSTDWRYQFQNDRITRDLAVAPDQVLISGEKYLYAFNTRELKISWRFRATQPLSAPVATAKHVFVGSENKLIYVLDRANGNLLSFVPTRGEILAAPTLTGPYLFVGSSDGKLYAFEEAPRPVYVQPPRRR